jgi:SAM-dependent methyltransferase
MAIEHRLVERTVPSELDTTDPGVIELLEANLEQYRYVASFCRDRTVLDVGCGAGFGTVLLSSWGGATSVVAIDIDKGLIDVARREHPDDAIEYRACALEEFDGGTFDLVCSINVLKHVADAFAFVGMLARRVAPGGELIVSAYITPTMDFNPFHNIEFSRGSFRRLVRRHGFVPVSELLQIKRFQPGRSMNLMKNKQATDDAAPTQPPLLSRYLRRPDRAVRRVWSLARDGFATKNLVIRARRTAG